MTSPALRRASARLGRSLGATARRLGIGPAAARAARSVLRRLEPGHPVLARAEAAQVPHPCEHAVPPGYQHAPVPGGGCLETRTPLSVVPPPGMSR